MSQQNRNRSVCFKEPKLFFFCFWFGLLTTFTTPLNNSLTSKKSPRHSPHSPHTHTHTHTHSQNRNKQGKLMEQAGSEKSYKNVVENKNEMQLSEDHWIFNLGFLVEKYLRTFKLAWSILVGFLSPTIRLFILFKGLCHWM